MVVGRDDLPVSSACGQLSSAVTILAVHPGSCTVNEIYAALVTLPAYGSYGSVYCYLEFGNTYTHYFLLNLNGTAPTVYLHNEASAGIKGGVNQQINFVCNNLPNDSVALNMSGVCN